MVDLRPATPVTSPIGGRPPGIRGERHGDLLRLSFAWRRFEHVALAFIGITWIGCSVALAVGSADPLGLWLAALAAFPGGAVAYAGLAGFLNRTRIQADASGVYVSHGPIPWRRPVRMDA